MNAPLGLHVLPDAELTSVLRALYEDRLATPVQRSSFMLAQLGHLEEHLSIIVGQPKTAAIAILSSVLAERSARRGAQAELWWAGPLGTGTGSREPYPGLQEWIATAERSVLWSGVSLSSDARLLRSLHAAQRGRELQVTLLLDTPGAADELSALASELFRSASTRPTLLLPAAHALLAPLPRCVVLDEERVLMLTGADVAADPDERTVVAGISVTEPSLARTLQATWQTLIDRGALVPLA